MDEGRKRATIFPLNLLGGRSSIEYQPKGVVGVIAPWNFPVGMVFEPLAGVLAAQPSHDQAVRIYAGDIIFDGRDCGQSV